jgi:REP element-mobilizing transposase RayT
MAIAYFSTWTTYGTWLPGDPRGWYEPCRGVQLADRLKELTAHLRATQSPLMLNPRQRQLVEATIADHCRIRKWTLHAVNCRSNHIHALVTAVGRDIELPREQFKAWCTRKLKELERELGIEKLREDWWTERGWDEFIDDDNELSDVNSYIRDGQDGNRFQ